MAMNGYHNPLEYEVPFDFFVGRFGPHDLGLGRAHNGAGADRGSVRILSAQVAAAPANVH
jgi:hypothetical protein